MSATVSRRPSEPGRRSTPTFGLLIGPPRSGTTLAAYLLAGGTGVLALSEPFLALAALPHWRLCRLFARLQRASKLTRLLPPRDETRERFARFVSDFARASGRPHLVLKETFRAGALPLRWRNQRWLQEQLDAGTRSVALIRHPYDTVASTVKLARYLTGWRGRLAALRWSGLPWFADPDAVTRWAAENWAALADWVGVCGIPVVRYEDLLTDTESTLRAMCQALAVPYERRMLDFDIRKRPIGGLGDPGVLLEPPRPIDRAAVGRGQALSDAQRTAVRGCCTEAAATHAYDL